jgi:hypothetical protein
VDKVGEDRREEEEWGQRLLKDITPIWGLVGGSVLGEGFGIRGSRNKKRKLQVAFQGHKEEIC